MEMSRVRFCAVVWLSIIVASLVWNGLGHAQEPTDVTAKEPEVMVKDVVISATKTPLPISQVTSAVEVISGEELERKKIKTVVDALRLAQGVAAFSSGGPGANATVRLRGAQSNHTLVILDGTIMNSPTTGEFDFANLTADNIERIEILRGAQSMLWGSDAIGGVINIFTKKGTGKPTASAFVEYGSFDSLREGIQVSGAKGPFDFSASLNRWDISSFSSVNYKRGAAERDGFHNWQGSGKLGMNLPKDGRFEFAVRWWNSDVHLDNAFAASAFAPSGAAFDVYGSRQTTRNMILSGMYEQSLTSWWTQKLTLARTNERTLFSSGTFQQEVTNTGVECPPGQVCPVTPFPGDIDVLNNRIEWQHNVQVAKSLLLTAGYQFREEQGTNPTIDPEAKIISSNAGFAQAQVNVADRLFATAGVRQDSYNVFGDATTYRVTGGYLHKETGSKVRFSYATGFRAPTINQLFFPFGFGNPDLKPEKSKSFDAGVDQHLFNERLTVSAGYFWNRFRDLILGVASPSCPPPFGFCAQNIGEAKSQGWELGFTASVLSNLDLKGQYTYTLTRDLTTTKRLPRWPIDQASVGISYRPTEPVRINVDYRFVGARNNDAVNTPNQRQGSFGVVNVSTTYDVTKQWQVFGRIDNLFNQGYEEVLFFGTPIRSVFGGVKFTY
jgi:vitamin B12 transporter